MIKRGGRKEERVQRAQTVPHRQGVYERYIKRPQDFLCALIATVVLSPVMLVTAVLVRVKLGRPVLFMQERPGLNGKIFKMYKFRTMADAYDENGEPLPDEYRLGRFGKVLRATSLDELPELLNILKGDMSIVGPRPLLVRYLPRYNAHQARRHEVRPGFTGLAQTHGRNSITWEEKFDWDVQYVDHISFLGDWKIIFDTIRVVLKRDGIHSDSSVTMEEFWGN
jgi:lipopolysaccharide/colanic/teichoic acid biosynthesis glycosyltransferase